MKPFNQSLLMLSVILLLSACSKPVPPERAPVIQPVKVVTVNQGAGTVARELPGSVRASQRVELSFQVPGRLTRFDLKEGQSVEAGQVLGELDNSDYKASFDAARAEMITAEANFKRGQELVAQDFLSKSDFDRLTSALEVSRANFRKAEKALKDTQLIAPFSGQVARKHVDNFEDVLAKQTIISLQDNNNLEITVDVSETLIARRDESVELQINARFEAIADRNFDVFVKEYTTEADPITQTFQFVLGIKDTAGANLYPGMTALVEISGKDQASLARFSLPLVAIVSGDGGQKSVWRVKKDNSIERVTVTVGDLIGFESIEITDGLNAGDTIVVAGLSALRNGLVVKPVTEVRF